MAAADQETHVSTVRARSYQDESYQHGFLGAVGDLQKEGELQDVVLEVEGRRFPCHRLVLSTASPYFRAMFTSDMAESRQKTVVLQGLDADMFEEILSYIYSGTLHVSLDRVQPLYQTADFLQLDYVSSSEEFCSLSVDQLTEIISQDKLEVKEETRVWEAVVRWVQHSREDRLQHLPSILPHIRFKLLTSDDMAAILDHPLVREDHGNSEIIRNGINWKPRPLMTTEMVLVFHDETHEVLWMNPDDEGKSIECYYNLVPFRGTVTHDNEIYVLAVHLDSSAEGSYEIILHKYNHVENDWEKKATVYKGTVTEGKVIPSRHFLMEANGHLFHLDTSSGVDFKKYNQHTNEWHNCSTPQQIGHFFAKVAVPCNQRIYLLTRTAMYWYDPREDQWTGKRLSDYSPEIKAEFCTAVAMGTEIFCTDDRFTKMLVYDTEADSWSERSGLVSTYEELGTEHCTLCVLQNKLHAFVLSWSYLRPYRLFYVYDRSEDDWRSTSIGPDGFWCLSQPTFPVARMYLPYLNTSHEESQGAANAEESSEE
ncbi:kelch repeat and BTB domain-containing protein 8-like isoform X2 [Branchiostoma floridae x Branchiostoma belcheri]